MIDDDRDRDRDESIDSLVADVESTGEDPAYACCDRKIPFDAIEAALPASTTPPHRTSDGTSFASGVVTCDECDAETELMVGTQLTDDRRLAVDVRTAPAIAPGFGPGTEPDTPGDAQPPRDAADDDLGDDPTEGAE